MKKAARILKRILRYAFRAVLVLLVLVFVASLLLLLPSVQTKLGHWASDLATERLGAEVRVERIEIRPFSLVRLHGLYIEDLLGDTLITARELRLGTWRVHPRTHRVHVRSLDLVNARFRLNTVKGDRNSNLEHVIAKLSGVDVEDTTTTPGWTIDCGKFNVKNLHFSFNSGNYDHDTTAIDFSHIDIPDATVAGSDLRVAGDSIVVQLTTLHLSEQCGLRVEELTGSATVSGRSIRVDHMHLRTPRSELHGQYKMTSTNWRAYSHYIDSVYMRLDVDTALLQFADVAWFAPQLRGVDLPVRVKGNFRGTVSELKGRNVDLWFGERSHFKGKGELSGLPNMKGTFMVIDVDELTTDAADLGVLPQPPFIEGGKLQMPVEVERLDNIAFRGNFTGFLNSFTARGRTRTGIGDLATSLSFRRDTLTNVFSAEGHLATTDFDIGRLVNDGLVGAITSDLQVSATGKDLKSMKADLQGTVASFGFNRKTITSITLNGRLERNLFNGTASIDDPKLQLDFIGLADLQGRWPKVDFQSTIYHADLRALDLLPTDKYNVAAAVVRAAGEFAPDSLKGFIAIEGISYCTAEGDHELGDILVRSDRQGGKPLLELRSTFADAEVVGTFLPTRLPDALKSVAYSVFPSLQEEVHYAQELQDFTFDVRVKEAKKILELVAPDLEVAPGSSFVGSFNSRTFDLGLTAYLPRARYATFSGDSVQVFVDKTLDVLGFSLRSARQSLSDSTWIGGIGVSGKAYQDEVELTADWEASSTGTNGELNLQGIVEGPRAIDLDLLPSKLFFGRGTWVNSEAAHIRIDTSTIRVDSLLLTNDGQNVLLNGYLSKDASLPLAFAVRDVRLENLMPFMSGPELHGILEGDGRVFDLYRSPFLLSYLCIDSMAVADKPLGDLRFAASWDNTDKEVDVNGTLRTADIEAVQFMGTVAPGRTEELDLQVNFDQFDLAFVNPFIEGGVSNIRRRRFRCGRDQGTIEAPVPKGRLQLTDAGLKIDYLNTSYRFSHTVDVQPNMLTIDFVKLYDEEGHEGTAIGTIVHNGFADWNFDVSVAMERMLCMNTTEAQNNLYFGKAYATGDVNISGYLDRLWINVDARTDRGTDIKFPLGGSTEVGGVDFIHFVSADSVDRKAAEQIDLTGIALDMKVHVTPDAQFELIFDPTVGDILRARAQGEMEMSVSPTGEFRMAGGLETTEGDYLFTLRNLVNKQFSLVPGGHITWFGDPFDAQLDLRAVYRLSAPLYDIMRENREAYRNRVPVEVAMHLENKLMNPDISYGIDLPRADEYEKAQVRSALSDPDELSRQVFFLIVLNKFNTPESYGQVASSTSNVGATTASELLSNQVSNWLSKLSSDVDLGVNYRPGSSVSQDEVELAVSTALLNERLLLSTNVGVLYGSTSATQANALIGDFQLEYLLTADGKLRSKVYSQSNDRNLNQVDQASTTQGVAIAYREEFNNLPELWQKFRNVFRRSEKDVKFD
ncbi:MAG: translocation/assembly module TamB [Flavobacteriales bacterium]|nr:translocation/assembly module TamB [Flavobacteriales bacterium]